MSLRRPLLSVIVVAFRSRDEIGACMASVPQALAGGEVEVVVVDNSLDVDGTASFLRAAHPRAQVVVPEDNLGFGRANNLAYRMTSGECVLFLNPDTVVNGPALERGLQRLRDDPGIGLFSVRLVQADGSLDLACRRSIPTAWDGFCRASGLAAAFPRTALFCGYNLTHLPEGGTYDVGAINGAFMMARRSFLDRVAEPGPAGACVFDERFFMYGDDLDLCLRASQAGGRIVYDGSESIVHLKGMSVGRDFDRMSKAIFDANRDVFIKHYARGPGVTSAIRRAFYRVLFGGWKHLSRMRGFFTRRRRVRPA